MLSELFFIISLNAGSTVIMTFFLLDASLSLSYLILEITRHYRKLFVSIIVGIILRSLAHCRLYDEDRERQAVRSRNYKFIYRPWLKNC
jgi:hypothetical protein